MSAVPQVVATTTAIRNILFTTDFSEASTRAFGYALALAQRHNATVHIVHVIVPRRR
jgi:nucleotide-binding universal stress UspA family protein